MLHNYPKLLGLYLFDDNTHQPLRDSYDPSVANWVGLNFIRTEKIDGTNLKVYRDGYTVHIEGRTNKPNAHIDENLWWLQEKFQEHIFEHHFGEKAVTIYGELYGGKINKGKEHYNTAETVKIFDIKVGEIWLTDEDMRAVTEFFGVQPVAYLFTGTIAEAESFVKEKLNEESYFEGIVGKEKHWRLERNGARIALKIKKEHLRLKE